MSPEPVAENPEGFLSVVVVTVDDGERLVDDILCHQHGVGCSPRLLPLRVEGEPGRNLVQLLDHEIKLKRSSVWTGDAAVLLFYGLFELLAEIFPDDVNDLAESGIDRVVD